MAFTNSQYNAIMRDYERVRAKKRAEYDERIKKVNIVIPQMKTLSESPSSLALKRYKEYKSGTKEAFNTLGAEIEEIKAKKKALLKEYGFPEDYMEMQYDCVDCKDSGMTEKGRCHCFNKKLLYSLYENSNLKNILENENFDTFNFEYFDEEKIISCNGYTEREYMKNIYNQCKKFVENFDTDKANIIFTGSTGVGKSFLSNCIAKELLATYHMVIYMTSMQLFDYLGKAKLEKDDSDEGILVSEYIDACELLIIDDLGTETDNTWTNSQLFRILNNRLKEEKSTIISTNLSLTEIRDRYSERISSRIRSSYKAIALYGEDIRRKKKVFGGENVKSK